MKKIVILFLIIVSAKAQEKETPIIIKTDIVALFSGIPISLEVGISSKSSIITDFKIATRTKKNDERLFLSRKPTTNYVIGYRQYITPQKSEKFKRFEGFYVQPSVFYEKYMESQKASVRLGSAVGVQFRNKKLFVIDLGVGGGFNIGNNPDEINRSIFAIKQVKIGFGWVIR